MADAGTYPLSIYSKRFSNVQNRYGANADGVHIGVTCQIRRNRPCAAAMQPFVKLLWQLVVLCRRCIYRFLSRCNVSNGNRITDIVKLVFSRMDRNIICTLCTAKAVGLNFMRRYDTNWDQVGYSGFCRCQNACNSMLNNWMIVLILLMFSYQTGKNEGRAPIDEAPKDRTYPLRHSFDDDDDDIDEGGEWILGRRRPLRSRSAGGRTPARRRGQRQKGRRTNGKGAVVARQGRGRRLMKRIIGLISQMPASRPPGALNGGWPEMQQNRKLNNYDRTDVQRCTTWRTSSRNQWLAVNDSYLQRLHNCACHLQQQQ